MAILTMILNILLVLTSLFLICLVLIQRGKGGGLAGAFGGVGGSSAFGTKAGDVFTRITIYTALVWIVLTMLLVKLSHRPNQSDFSKFGSGGGTASQTVPEDKSGSPDNSNPAPAPSPEGLGRPSGGPSPTTTVPDSDLPDPLIPPPSRSSLPPPPGEGKATIPADGNTP